MPYHGTTDSHMVYERRNIPLYVANIIFLFFGLAVLIWLKTRFDNDLRTAINSASLLFSREEVLKAPDDVRIDFSQIEYLARRNRNIYIKDVVVSKIVEPSGEVTVFPFYLGALNPNWRDMLINKGWKQVELKTDDELYGVLYLRLNDVLLNGIKFAILSFALLLIVSLAVLLFRLYRQEGVITATSSALREKNQELMRLERLALAGQLTANIFHDIKKPILNIKHALSDSLEKKEAVSQNIQETLDNMQEQVGMFFSIINELGIERFVRASNEEREYVDINDMLERSCNLVRYEQRQITITKDFAPDLPPLFVNPYKIIQFFSNIILNAYQAMQGKGELRICTGAQERRITVKITDTGPGIREDHISRLFTPFFSTKNRSEAAGLGLYICKNIVDELHGTIEVDSKPGSGTSFIIHLPTTTPPDNAESGQP